MFPLGNRSTLTSVLFGFFDSVRLHFMTIQSSNLVSTVADNAFQLPQLYLIQEAITKEGTDDNSSPYAYSWCQTKSSHPA